MSDPTIGDRVVDLGKSVVGLDANPGDADSRRQYLDFIAPGEAPRVQAEMAEMSGCGLVVAGLWRAAGVDDARLEPPYRVGTAISRLMAIAHTARAWIEHAPDRIPSPGDMVLVGDNATGGVEHVYTVTRASSAEGLVSLESVDGGQRDARGFETILAKTRTWKDGRDHVDGSLARVIKGWIDVSLLPARSVAPVEDAARLRIQTLEVDHTLAEKRALAGLAAALPVGATGADSSMPITHTIGGKTLVDLARTAFGTAPVFWGRYFTSTTAGGPVEYRHASEDAPLRDAGTRVLPIARQTNHVNRGRADGLADGKANAADLLQTFGVATLVAQGGEFLMFLDVEGAPSLSSDYYRGWVEGLASAQDQGVTLHPCVYATQYDTETWSALAAACAGGAATCKGLWIAHWTHTGFHLPDAWSARLTTPLPSVSFKVLAWQYANDAYGSEGFDCNQVNPSLDLQGDFLRYLVLPP